MSTRGQVIARQLENGSVVEVIVLLVRCVASLGHLLSDFSRPIGHLETSGTNYVMTRCYIPDQQRPIDVAI